MELEQNDRYLENGILKAFLQVKFCILIQISLKFFPEIQ